MIAVEGHLEYVVAASPNSWNDLPATPMVPHSTTTSWLAENDLVPQANDLSIL